jgi:uncharacterized protein YjiS (DUF1127 family)
MSLKQPASAFPQTRSAFFRDVVAMIIFGLRKEIAAAIERRRIRATLHALDDYLLKDMGIYRSDIDRIARSRPAALGFLD